MRFRLSPLFFVAIVLWSTVITMATEGDAVALIRLPNGGIQVESMGNHSVRLDHVLGKTSNAIEFWSSGNVVLVEVPASQSQQALVLAKKLAAKRLILGGDVKLDGAIRHVGNTLPLSSTSVLDSHVSIQIIQLSKTPVDLPAEVMELIKRKEVSCRASQDVFSKLSAQQMNFRPANGSHTPRWNAEHMMGRELLFFSQIYHAIDPAIPIMDLNPKQMPPDYKAKHPDWTGEEEARQMERVTAFMRRFSYLLKDLPFDKKASGSGWTPRGLLKQMERHYNEHTANVKLKFKLPDWPAK